MDSQAFIHQKFAEFYEENASRIEAPPSIRQREFGFMVFQENIMVRHKSFKDAEALRTYMKEAAPAHAYHSTAYYELPEERMENKGWLGADLYFDIDADHIATKCKETHDQWTCKDCGFGGKGQPDVCPACGSRRFDQRIWPCDECLGAAKRETIKLVEMLTAEFGFTDDEVEVSFSGHRGYHVHVAAETARDMDAGARKELVDYITGTGLNTALFSPEAAPPASQTAGWQSRIANGAYEFLRTATAKDLESLGMKEKRADSLLSNRQLVLKIWEKSGPWRPVTGIGKEELKLFVNRAVENTSSKIDTMVTTDIHRLIRLLNSLHGKTGWLKVAFPTSTIDAFDPLKGAVAFKRGEVKLYVEKTHRFRIGDEWYGGYENQRVELPTAAAVFLLCKDAAKLVD
jgi:DNA primase small subunit